MINKIECGISNIMVQNNIYKAETSTLSHTSRRKVKIIEE